MRGMCIYMFNNSLIVKEKGNIQTNILCFLLFSTVDPSPLLMGDLSDIQNIDSLINCTSSF